jgi:gluconate 5-dehydrogenase
MGADLFDLTGRLALVTGSSRGIGLALARGLAAAGARVIVNARQEASLTDVASALSAMGCEVLVCAFDVTDPQAVAAGVAFTRHRARQRRRWDDGGGRIALI